MAAAFAAAAVTAAPITATPARAAGPHLAPAAGLHLDSAARAIRAGLSQPGTAPQSPQDESLRRFYELRGFQPAWTAPLAAEVQKALAHAADEGLNPADYAVGQPPPRPSAGAAAAWDLQLSRVFLHYAGDVHGGRLAPDKAYDDVSLPPQPFDAPAELAAALKTGALAGFIAGLPPSRPEYAFLREALAHYRAVEAGGPGTAPVKPGTPLNGLPADMRDKLRLRLAADDPEIAAAGPVLSDTALRAALRRFQARFGLQDTGTLNAETAAILKQPISDRVLQIEANMERWRWLPRRPDPRYIEVNTPDASLKVVDNAKTVLRSPVVLGQPDWATPILATTVQAVVINPPWHVPSDLAGEEILPHLMKDASYLATHDMVLTDGPAQDPTGRTVNWREVPADPFPYSIEQRPGPRSGLGALLLDMPNGFGVYLHDTPDKQLFAQGNRFLSHGCVRARGIAEVASYALFGDTTQAGRMPHPPRTQTQRVPLDQPLPVYMLYWTVFQDADGAIAFRKDVYGRDVTLIAALYGRDIHAPGHPARQEAQVAQAPAP